MSSLTSTIRPAPSGAGGGPFYSVTEQDGSVTKVTTGLSTIANAINQATGDQVALVTGQGLTVSRIQIFTIAT